MVPGPCHVTVPVLTDTHPRLSGTLGPTAPSCHHEQCWCVHMSPRDSGTAASRLLFQMSFAALQGHTAMSAWHFTSVLAVLCNAISLSRHRQTEGLANTFHTLDIQGMMPTGKPRMQPPPLPRSGQPVGHLCPWGRAAGEWGRVFMGMRGRVWQGGGAGLGATCTEELHLPIRYSFQTSA